MPSNRGEGEKYRKARPSFGRALCVTFSFAFLIIAFFFWSFSSFSKEEKDNQIESNRTNYFEIISIFGKGDSPFSSFSEISAARRTRYSRAMSQSVSPSEG